MLNLKVKNNDAEIDFKGRLAEVMAELTVAVLETIKTVSEESNIKYDDLLTPFLAIMLGSKKGR